MSDVEFGGQPAEATGYAPDRVETPSQTPERGLEDPIPGLPEAFGALRNEEVGKPIAVGGRGEDGQPTSDTKFVGHILETDGPNWHVIILDNGYAATVGRQHGDTKTTYDAGYTGSEPIIFPPGTSKVDVFKDLVSAAGNNGSAIYATTQDPAKVEEIKGKVRTAVGRASETIAARRSAREQVGQMTVQAINAALSPDSRPSQS